MPTAHGGVEEGMSQDDVVADGIWGTTDSDWANGSINADGEPMETSDFAGTGDLGASETEDRGNGEGK